MGFLSQKLMSHRTAGKGGSYSLTPLYYFHLLYRHVEISQAIAAESSPLHTARDGPQARNPWFRSANC